MNKFLLTLTYGYVAINWFKNGKKTMNLSTESSHIYHICFLMGKIEEANLDLKDCIKNWQDIVCSLKYNIKHCNFSETVTSLILGSLKTRAHTHTHTTLYID